MTSAIIGLTASQNIKTPLSKNFDSDYIQNQQLPLLSQPSDIPSYLPINLDLSKEESELELLRTPSQDYLEPPYSVPSRELQAPSVEAWNPNNDPKYYYELPALLTKQDTPTNIYPKKFSKELYEKQKPLSSKPKQEIVLIPISEEEVEAKEKNVGKVLLNLAKIQNQKKLQSEKVQSSKPIINDQEPQTSDFSNGFDSQGTNGFSSANTHLAPPAPHTRQEFQMHGFDGPHSYKWGYDTGKG